MAAYAALASLMNTVEQITNHPRLSASLDDRLVRPLLATAGSLLDFISGGTVSEEGAEDLERRIARAAHAAEDAIESHVIDQIHAGTADVSPSCSLRLQQITQDMDAILREAEELKERERLRKEEKKEEQSAHSATHMETGEKKEAAAMVGFEEEQIQILDMLTNCQPGRHVISIVGMGGMGKTTLARNIYQHSLIKGHFDVRAWATVSQNYDLKEILSQLLGSVGESWENLHKHLFGRRYLIVLDDIWSVKAWDEVRLYFPDNGNGSRVVLTTRSLSVARDCSSSSCCTMQPLDEHTSWKLFCQKAFERENCPYPELESVGMEIARLCKGLPLSTVVIGGLLLNSPRTLQVWEKVVSNIKSNPNSKEKEESLGILSLSYNHLPPHLKPCFLYMGVFKEDSDIRVSKVTKLWVGEGFLRPVNDRVLEEVAEGYLKELIDRNLIFVKKRGKNGRIKSCGIHDLVRDLSLNVGEQQEFFHLSTIDEMQGMERRIISRDYYWKMEEYREPSVARSLCGSLINMDDYKLVRVCDEAFIKPESKVYEKVNLRCVYCTFYEDDPYTKELPSSISLIWNLQTLIIRYTPVVAPVEIWKMRQLRHIKGHRFRLPDPPLSDGLLVMDNLQTLKKAMGLRLWEQVCKMIPNIKKLHLLCHELDDTTEYRYLECLHKLESLSLSRVNTYDEYIELRKRLTLPVSLNKLSLDRCILETEDLRMIGLLPQLEVLELKNFFLVGELSFIEGQFLRLKFLRLESYGPTFVLNADGSCFPLLEKLFLRSLSVLEEIPSSIGEIATLELISVELCSESAAISAIRIKEDQLQNEGDDALQVHIKIYSSKLESFMELVGREELTIDNIHLETHS